MADHCEWANSPIPREYMIGSHIENQTIILKFLVLFFCVSMEVCVHK